MRRDVPTSVGDHGGEVAELERGSGDLTLSHAYPHDRRAVPVAMATAQVCRVGDAAAHLVGDVHAERSSETEAMHILCPTVDGAVLGEIRRAVVDHLLESLTEVSLCRLKGRAGRVGLGDGAVHSVVDFVVAIEAEDATCRRFYGYDASLLALQQLTG